eukprot:639656-Pleurochrysis_carterae.AAC.2
MFVNCTLVSPALSTRLAALWFVIKRSEHWHGSLSLPCPSSANVIRADAHAPCADSVAVADVRVLGAIGVVEMKQPIDMRKAQARLASMGVWLRPFGKLLYTMPPFVISDADLKKIADGMRAVIEDAEHSQS